MIGSTEKLLQARAGVKPVETAWNLTSSTTYPTNLTGKKLVTGSASQLRFSPDGTKMISWSYGSTLYEYSLSTPWDETTITYIRSVSVNSGHDFDVSPDGTKLFICTASSSTVYTYTLSTPWSLVSIGTPTSWVIPVAAPFNSQVSYGNYAAWGIKFKSDGTRVLLGAGNGDIYVTFTLSTPWDLSTATSDVSGVNFRYFNDNTSYSGAISINANGTRLSMSCGGSGYTHMLTLSTPWDITGTATMTSGYGGGGYANAWKTDGMVFYGSGGNYSGTTIRAQNVTSAYSVESLTTTSFATFDTSASTGSSTIKNIVFSSDGAKLYALKGNIVYQYTLSTAWDITTLSYTGYSKTITVTVNDLDLASDGTKLFVLGDNEYVHEISMSTPYDLSTGTVAQKGFVRGFLYNNGKGIAVSPDGTKLYSSSNPYYMAATVYQLSMTTAFDTTTLPATAPAPTAGISVNRGGRTNNVSPDGTKIYGSFNGPYYQYNLTTPWNIMTLTSGTNQEVVFPNTYSEGVAFNSDGTKAFYGGQQIDSLQRIYSSSLSSPYVVTGRKQPITTTSPIFSYPTNTLYTSILQAGGSKWIRADTGTVYVYDLTTPYDGLSAVLSNSRYLGQTCTNFRFSDDGLLLFGIYSSNLRHWSLTTPYLLSTATYIGSVTFPSSATYCSSGYALEFSDNGSKLYTMCSNTKKVVRWGLSTPWDKSTLAFEQEFVFSSKTTAPYTSTFGDSGKKLYISAYNAIYQWSLSTGYDLSTTTYDGMWNFWGSTSAFYPRGISFNDIGKTAYISNQNGSVLVFNL